MIYLQNLNIYISMKHEKYLYVLEVEVFITLNSYFPNLCFECHISAWRCVHCWFLTCGRLFQSLESSYPHNHRLSGGGAGNTSSYNPKLGMVFYH